MSAFLSSALVRGAAATGLVVVVVVVVLDGVTDGVVVVELAEVVAFGAGDAEHPAPVGARARAATATVVGRLNLIRGD
jgi:hypothetical protein